MDFEAPEDEYFQLIGGAQIYNYHNQQPGDRTGLTADASDCKIIKIIKIKVGGGFCIFMAKNTLRSVCK